MTAIKDKKGEVEEGLTHTLNLSLIFNTDIINQTQAILKCGYAC